MFAKMITAGRVLKEEEKRTCTTVMSCKTPMLHHLCGISLCTSKAWGEIKHLICARGKHFDDKNTNTPCGLQKKREKCASFQKSLLHSMLLANSKNWSCFFGENVWALVRKRVVNMRTRQTLRREVAKLADKAPNGAHTHLWALYT